MFKDKSAKASQSLTSQLYGIQGNEIHVFQCEHFVDARIKYDIDEMHMTYTRKSLVLSNRWTRKRRESVFIYSNSNSNVFIVYEIHRFTNRALLGT